MALPDIEAQALTLDPRDRAHLAHVMITSLADLSAEQIDELWLEEAERRDADLESGRATSVPASEVFARIRQRHS